MGGAILQPGEVFAEDFRIVGATDSRGPEAYVVEQLSTGTQRILRLLPSELVADEGRRARFEQEARIGSRIDSKHVIEVVGAGIDSKTGAPWLARELVSGEDLASLVKREGALPVAIGLEILEQLGDAVGAAHATGIIHGDLKPDNVFLAEPSGASTKYRVKVLDFGIARLIAESKAEQASRGVGPEADVRSIGLIALHLLTGQSLGPAGERVRTPPGFDAWLARSIDPDASERFRDVRAQIQALRPLLGAATSASASQDDTATASPVEPAAAAPLDATAHAPPEPAAVSPAEPAALAPPEPAAVSPVEPAALAPPEPAAVSPVEPAAEPPAAPRQPPARALQASPAVPAQSSGQTRTIIISAVAIAALVSLTSTAVLVRKLKKLPTPASTEGRAVASVAIPVEEAAPVPAASDSDASQPAPQVDASGDDAASATAATLPSVDHGSTGANLNFTDCTAGPRLSEDEVRTIVNRNSGALKQACWDKSPTPGFIISESLHVVICGTGAVQSVIASGNDAPGRCMENMVKGWRFPAGGTLDIPVRFTRDAVPTGPAAPGPFDRGAAYGALGSVNVQSCKRGDSGRGHVQITFAPRGQVTSAVVDSPPFAGTAVGNCVSAKFRGAHIPPFLGPPITLGKSFTIN